MPADTDRLGLSSNDQFHCLALLNPTELARSLAPVSFFARRQRGPTQALS